MSFLKKLFAEKQQPIGSYAGFWNWFAQYEKAFFSAVRKQKNIEQEFFNKLSAKLNELMEGIYYLTGMYDDQTAELIFTAEGNVKLIPFVEDLVSAAPPMERWKFTALKPALDIEDVSIQMAGHQFDEKNIRFYSNDHPAYPDEIDIAVLHEDLDEENRSKMINGVYIFLDNFLGELDLVTLIDNLRITGTAEAEKELIPVRKLKDFLKWRQKEFIEKYDGTRYDTDNDVYSILEAKLESGRKLVAVINTDLLTWDRKASHPWILKVVIRFDGSRTNGMPDTDSNAILDEIEDVILQELKDADGYLNIGRQTAEGSREIYFACKEFRKPARLLHRVQKDFAPRIGIDFDIYKDKYWQSFERFNTS
jgi:Family of unknown function (DUF695)